VNNVVSLDLVRQAKLSPHAAFEASRQQMLRDFLSWMQTEPEPEIVREEISGAVSAIQQIAELYGVPRG